MAFIRKSFCAVGVFICALTLDAACARAQTPVTSCGQLVADGVLIADLDCSDVQSAAVHVRNGGSLNLAGFTYTAGDGSAVVCDGKCTIIGGGGKIKGAGQVGISARRASIMDLAIEDRGRAVSAKTVTATNLSVQGHDVAVGAKKVELQGCVVTDGAFGIFVERRGSVTDCVVSNHDYTGIEGVDARIVVTNSTIQSNSDGFATRRGQVIGSTITNNLRVGAYVKMLTVEQSTIAANGLGSECVDLDWCADILARRLRAGGLTCDTSLMLDDQNAATGQTWGVCSDD